MNGSDCPPWCANDHGMEAVTLAHTDQVHEFVHAAPTATVPIVVLTKVSPSHTSMEAAELDMVLFQDRYANAAHAQTEEEWLFIGNDYGGITMTRESAGRVYRLLGKVLAQGL